jgi:hypothetical protein
VSKFITVQVARNKWIVAQSTGGGPYRKVCECATEYGANLVRDALNKVQP